MDADKSRPPDRPPAPPARRAPVRRPRSLARPDLDSGREQRVRDFIYELHERAGRPALLDLEERIGADLSLPGAPKKDVVQRIISRGGPAAQADVRTVARMLARDCGLDEHTVDAQVTLLLREPVPPPPGPFLAARSAYLAQGRRIAPPVLEGREAELADLAGFCLEPGRGPAEYDSLVRLLEHGNDGVSRGGEAYWSGGPTADAAVPLVGRIPRTVDGFQERLVIGEVNAALADDRLMSIVGMGGVGKTQLATCYARGRLDARDVNLVVWVDASSRDAVVSRYAEAGVMFAEADPGDPDRAAERFLAWLETTPQRWLVVLDNLDQSLGELWPPTQNPAGRTIITARRRDPAIVGRGHRVVEVDVFTEAEAQAYLGYGLPEWLTDDVAGVVADLGRLPLALGQAAAYIFNQDVPCGEYRRRFADRSKHLADLVPERRDLPDGHRDPVPVTWLLSIEAADAGRPAGLARPVLELASMLHPDGIPAGMFATAAATNWLSYARSVNTGTEPGEELDAGAVHDALRCLHKYSLASVDTDVVRVHTLVQRAVRDDLPAGRLAELAWAAADALHDVWPDNGIDPVANQRLRASVGALNRHSSEYLWDAAGYHPVLDDLGKSLGHAGQEAAAAEHFAGLRAAASERLGPDRPVTLAAHGFQAVWQGAAGDVMSLDTARQLVNVRRRVYGPDHHETHNARHTLALAYGRFGDPEAAVAELESLRADRAKLIGDNHRATLQVRHNLAMYRGEAGDATGAIAEFEAVLAATERALGPDDPETHETRHELARWRSRAGDPTRAATEFTQLRADRERVLGPDHPKTLLTRLNLASAIGRAGDMAGAIAEYEDLLNDRLRVLGPDHADTLYTRFCLIVARAKAGPLSDSIAGMETLLDEMVHGLGRRHPYTGEACSWLADLRDENGDPKANAINELFAACLRVYGPDHPDTLAARNKLARSRGEAGDPAGAAIAYEDLLAACLRVYGPEDHNTLATRNNLAQSRGEAGDAAGAVAELAAVLADIERVFGPDHPETLATRNNLAWLKREGGDAAGAVAAFDQLLTGLLRAHAPDHPSIWQVRAALALARIEAGDVAGTVTTLEGLVNDLTRLHGPDHQETLGVRARLAQSRADTGDFASAIVDYKALLADCLRVHGPDHPDTIMTRASIVDAHDAAGDFAGAAEACKELLAACLRVHGPDHADTLGTRNNLARWRGEVGDAAGAAAAYEELLPDMLRASGPDHPNTLTTRHNLARWRGETGDATGAAAAFGELLPDMLRVLGPDHPDTLTTRGRLAYWRGTAGDHAGAAAAFGKLLPDCVRVFGPDHPHTLSARYGLARWRGEAGDAAGAAAAYEELLADMLRVLGPDHPHTLTIRHEFTSWRTRAEDEQSR